MTVLDDNFVLADNALCLRHTDCFLQQPDTVLDLFYYLTFDMLMFLLSRAKEGGRKSFRREELNPDYYLPKHNGILVPYLDILQKDLEDRDYT